ncbi:uncharacterized protein LOC116412934 [Galleria mellonella]|uniref:Uncharacterized protein LOC116412934 n=1 Tax=Galleria mellonella TaxID=7137 RepID=A0ABM3MF70_GALME|nr:uncharacterized protein LOC116412934 [Galleria mellonella]
MGVVVKASPDRKQVAVSQQSYAAQDWTNFTSLLRFELKIASPDTHIKCRYFLRGWATTSREVATQWRQKFTELNREVATVNVELANLHKPYSKAMNEILVDNEEDEIYRPCHIDDLNCMRKFLASRRHCYPPPGRVPDPYLRDNSILNYVDFNITVININSKISGLNGIIKEFHVNKRTNQLVIAVWFDTIDVPTERSVVYHHRNGRVPIVTSDWSRIIYRRTLITTTTPLSSTIDFRYTVVYGYSEDGNPRYGFGSGINNHPSPIVQGNVASFMANIDLAVRNAFLTEARSYIRIFIQNVLCGYDVVL